MMVFFVTGLIWGLSPRVRGNPERPIGGQPYRRSIPARAGEPPCAAPCVSSYAVYPRACGGTEDSDGDVHRWEGLSPRVRGNPPCALISTGRQQVYPRACGGTGQACTGAAALAVYPHACGGTTCGRVEYGPNTGLSPRVRGNRHLEHRVVSLERSIPARAGEPNSVSRVIPDGRVYPRACGGNLDKRAYSINCDGSIPARAGEPEVARRG